MLDAANEVRERIVQLVCVRANEVASCQFENYKTEMQVLKNIVDRGSD
jgi:hypothetical protein